jgi:hypothetical protein
VSVPRISEVGPSFKSYNEHFRVFALDDGRIAFVTGNAPWGRGELLPIEPPEGVDIQYCNSLSSAKDEWDECEAELKYTDDTESANLMRRAWVAWSADR